MGHLVVFQTVQTHGQHILYTHQYFQVYPNKDIDTSPRVERGGGVSF